MTADYSRSRHSHHDDVTCADAGETGHKPWATAERRARPDLRLLADNLLIALGMDPDDQERWESAYHSLHEAARGVEARLAEAVRLLDRASDWILIMGLPSDDPMRPEYEPLISDIGHFLAATATPEGEEARDD